MTEKKELELSGKRKRSFREETPEQQIRLQLLDIAHDACTLTLKSVEISAGPINDRTDVVRRLRLVARGLKRRCNRLFLNEVRRGASQP